MKNKFKLPTKRFFSSLAILSLILAMFSPFVSATAEDGTKIVDNFYASLEIMGLGMVGIFIVMLLIFLTVYILTKTTKDKNNKQDK